MYSVNIELYYIYYILLYIFIYYHIIRIGLLVITVINLKGKGFLVLFVYSVCFKVLLSCRNYSG